jgi:hypothetical protein
MNSIDVKDNAVSPKLNYDCVATQCCWAGWLIIAYRF